MKNKSQIGQEIRWVRKYNRAMDRAFRHFRNCRLVEGATNPRTISTNILNLRAFKRHFRQACKIESRHALTIIDTASLPPEDAAQVEPSYS